MGLTFRLRAAGNPVARETAYLNRVAARRALHLELDGDDGARREVGEPRRRNGPDRLTGSGRALGAVEAVVADNAAAKQDAHVAHSNTGWRVGDLRIAIEGQATRERHRHAGDEEVDLPGRTDAVPASIGTDEAHL